MKNEPDNLSRRRFLKTSAALGSVSALPSYVALGNKSSGGEKAPSERINVAFIASAGKGYRNRLAFEPYGLMNVVALCDVDQGRKEAKESAAAHPKAKLFTDYRVMFDKMAAEIDAVVVSTPDQTHFPATMLAMAHGKHVWCEKPLAHTFGQCERMMDLAKRSGVVTQMGNQGHSGFNYFQFKSWTEAGLIKDITRITAYQTNGNRWSGWGHLKEYPSQPLPEGLNWDVWLAASKENPYSDLLHPGKWRGWYDYGCGMFGDWGVHVIDTCHRFLKLGYPSKIKVIKLEGGSDLVYPAASRMRFDFPEREGMPACEMTWVDGFRKDPKIEPEYRDLASEQPEYIYPQGQKRPRSAYVGKVLYSKDLVFRGGSHSEPLRIVPRQKYLDMRRDLPPFSQRNSDHWENFLLACKGEEEARSPFSVAAPLTQVLNLGTIAQRLRTDIEFDRETKKITNIPEANALLDPAPRKGWEEFYKL